MNKDQITSLVRSACKIVGAAMVAHGMQNAGSWVNTEDTVGLIVAFIGLVLSHYEHSS